jgi:hypothetical protein
MDEEDTPRSNGFAEGFEKGVFDLVPRKSYREAAGDLQASYSDRPCFRTGVYTGRVIGALSFIGIAGPGSVIISEYVRIML